MGCHVINAGGISAIVCDRGRRPKRCRCGAAAQFLCDHEIAPGKTCDQPLCRSCTVQPRPGRDLCEAHAPVVDAIACPYCNGRAPRVTGREIYPHRPDLAAKQFYLCRPCNAYCGTHPDGKPLGGLADEHLRRARSHVHAIFDPLWQGAEQLYHVWNVRTKNTARGRAYKWLAHHMQIPLDLCHVGMFDLEQCRQAWRIIRREQPTPAQIRTWAKERRR